MEEYEDIENDAPDGFDASAAAGRSAPKLANRASVRSRGRKTPVGER